MSKYYKSTNSSITTNNATSNGLVYSDWGDFLLDITNDLNDLNTRAEFISQENEDVIKEKIAEKIDEILSEDRTIDLMKKYLLKFIEENIDNPENLIKEVLIDKDKELEKYKKELISYKEELEELKKRIFELEIILHPLGYPANPSPYITPWTTPNITC